MSRFIVLVLLGAGCATPRVDAVLGVEGTAGRAPELARASGGGSGWFSGPTDYRLGAKLRGASLRLDTQLWPGRDGLEQVGLRLSLRGGLGRATLYERSEREELLGSSVNRSDLASFAVLTGGLSVGPVFAIGRSTLSVGFAWDGMRYLNPPEEVRGDGVGYEPTRAMRVRGAEVSFRHRVRTLEWLVLGFDGRGGRVLTDGESSGIRAEVGFHLGIAFGAAPRPAQ